MTTYSISWIGPDEAESRGYAADFVGWVLEMDGEWLADLREATQAAHMYDWTDTVGMAQDEARPFLAHGGGWVWTADSSWSPARDFTATRDTEESTAQGAIIV